MNLKPLIKCYGSATVGERGQVVLPIEVRKLFSIKPGDTLIVMGTQGGPFKGVSLMKSEEVTRLVEHMFSMGESMKEGFRDIEKTLKKPFFHGKKAPLQNKGFARPHKASLYEVGKKAFASQKNSQYTFEYNKKSNAKKKGKK